VQLVLFVRAVGDDLLEYLFDLMCGTISPPIFENRLARSVMMMNPSPSILAMSP